MYCSISPSNFKWSKQYPKRNIPDDPKKRIFCNGRPTNPKDWRLSREHHRNMARYWSNAVTHLLTTLPKQMKIFKGNISMPNKSPDEWRLFKRIFGKSRSYFISGNKCELSIVCKQHIVRTINGDDMHFDFIGFSDLPEQEIKENILNWINKAGGSSRTSSLKIIEDHSPHNLQDIVEYTFKFANSENEEHLDRFNRSFPLPSTQFPVTWVVGNFWRRSKETISSAWIFDGQIIETTRKLSPMQLTYLDFINTWATGIPVYTSYQYRQEQYNGV